MPSPDTSAVAHRKDSYSQQRIFSIPSNEANPCVALDLTDCRANDVFVVSSFNGWQVGATPMMALGEGMWGVRLELPPGRYEYQFVVDGRWMPDPNAEESARNDSGGVNSVLIVRPEPTADLGRTAQRAHVPKHTECVRCSG